MKKIINFFNEFKEFLLASTFVDVAIGLLIAGAVKELATSFTSSFITPLIMKLFAIMGINSDSSSATTIFGIDFYITDFISALIGFIIILFIAFGILYGYAKVKERLSKDDETTNEVELTNEEKLLTEIRDLLDKNNNK